LEAEAEAEAEAKQLSENEANYFCITREIKLHIKLHKQKLLPKISQKYNPSIRTN